MLSEVQKPCGYVLLSSPFLLMSRKLLPHLFNYAMGKAVFDRARIRNDCPAAHGEILLSYSLVS